MTVDDMKKEKELIENKISSMLNDFQEKINSHISVKILEHYTMFQEYAKIEVEITIEM